MGKFQFSPGKRQAIVYRCSFCGKSQEQVRRLIAGPNAVYICNECVALCQEIIDEESALHPAPEHAPGQSASEQEHE